ncbi:hypothetical protein BpJC7_28010 [Weizmannia acidilactici]|uniref:Type I restriction modification DNA specificity domain-containing protein n=1 Tax=Weizmannia acidilactici TaxID=2607726 RepID=A0A5J4JLQ8_9BACI|nr:restriction endonuclease subunit S [Weizmannia acidilactici]GER71498.1 hypothetical protein BpJC7_28010 [Weizmannia acidilactici]
MKLIKLKDAFKIRKGKKVEPVKVPGENTVRYIQIEDLRDNHNPKFCQMQEGYIYAKKDNIIIAWDGANAGTVSYGIEGVIGSTLAVLETDLEEIYTPYIGKFLQSKFQYLRNTSTGATIPHISRKALENLEIPLPEVEKQKLISKTLDQAQELIDKRKSQIEALDQLTQSVFLEMFGDQAAEKVPLSKICDINPTKNEIRDINDDLEVSFVPMSKVSEKGDIDLTETRKVKEVNKGFTYFKENDVLFAKITPCMENGKGAIARNLRNGIGFGSTEFHVLRPKENISSEWLFYLTSLPEFRTAAEMSMTGSAGQKRVPKQFFDQYKTTIPTIDDQKSFIQIIYHIQKQKEVFKQSLLKLQDMQQSIFQRAFKGELFTEKEEVSAL